MKKLISWLKPSLTWLKWVDDNIINIFLTLFIFIIPLYPKFPFIDLEYTYVSVRLEDIFIIVFFSVFIIQVLRNKIVLRTKFLLLFALFWISVLISFFVGFYVIKTIPVRLIGLLHALRRIEYMFVFFIAASAIKSKKQFLYFIKLYAFTVLLVSLYGIGQRFLDFPAVQTMNPEFARGRVLYLTPEARISSTFGGHFDLAAYLVFSIPLILGYYFLAGKKKVIAIFILALTTLLYTAQRSAFAAYVVSISTFLLLLRKFRFYIFVVLITGLLMLTTGDLVTRFVQTFQLKKIFINTSTGGVTIGQKITTKELPAGNVEIPVPGKKKKAQKPTDDKTQQEVLEVAKEQALLEAKSQGKTPTNLEIEKRAQQIAPKIAVKKTLLCDISCSTRIQIEWPRAIAAFLYSPFFGTGPSSITEATDNDYLRWIGETGLFGAGLFLFILFSIIRLVYRTIKKMAKDDKDKYIYHGFLFGLFALLINATYVDVFEASKVAYNFWLIAGLIIGMIAVKKYDKRENK